MKHRANAIGIPKKKCLTHLGVRKGDVGKQGMLRDSDSGSGTRRLGLPTLTGDD